MNSISHRSLVMAQISIAMILALTLAVSPAGQAAAAPRMSTITVNTTADEYGTGAGCSLREAISAANNNAAFGGCPAGAPGADTIQLPAGMYVLSIPNAGGVNEDNNASGDLDIHETLVLQGAGSATTLIDANDIDKVIAANPYCNNGVSVTIDGMTIRNGTNSQPYGAGDWSFTGGGIDWCGGGSGNFTLRNAVVADNVNQFGYGGGLNTDSINSYSGMITLENVVFSNNRTNGASGRESNGGGLNLFGENPTVTITNCTFNDNQAAPAYASGGAMFLRLGYGGAITIHNTVVNHNTSGSMGGGIYVNFANSATQLVIDQNTRITNNISGAASGGTSGGSGIVLDGVGNTSPARLSKVVITGNLESPSSLPSARQGGAGIYVGNANVIVEYSRITGNTLASGSQGSGLFKSTDAGTVTATNNWWGCSTGPGAAPCDTAVLDAGSSGSLTSAPYLRVLTTAAPSTVELGQTSALTASVNTNSAGANVSANVERLIGLPVAWSAATGGLSGQQLTIQANGTATATFLGNQAGSQKAAARVDNDSTTTGSNVATITVNKADTTTTITSDTPDPSLAGTAVTATYTVTHNATGAPPALTGTVTVTDGVDSCTASAAAGSCSLTLTTPGGRSLSATYSGDTNYNSSVTTVGTPHTVQQPPAITSANTATFTVGVAGTFEITTSGYPPEMVITQTGELPAGVTFADNGDGTATLSGTPAVGEGGVYTLTLGAANGVSPDATQIFTLTVNEAPAITSANAATFTAGAPGTFDITTSGYPVVAAITQIGSLPTGVTFLDNGNGTAKLSGTPAAGTGGVYTLTLGAANGVSPDVSQTFTLTVNEAPVITSANAATFTVGTGGSFTITTSGYPAVTAVTQTGSLPDGVTFTDLGDGTATLSGTPAAGMGGTYALTLGAGNGVTPDAAQSFTLTVNEAPAITSLNNVMFAVGIEGSFTITTTGYPAAAINVTGALPAGVTLTDLGNGSATMSGTPAVGSGGWYSLTITAANGVGSDATQAFTFLVSEDLTFTSADHATFTAGTAHSFTITTQGYPTPALSATGTLPAGVTFLDNGNGTATLSGTPAAGTGGVYTLTLTADNGMHVPAGQTFTLTVQQPSVITSANSATFTAGTPGNFNVTSTGYPINTLSASGALPGGVTFVDGGNNTGALSGTPAAGSGGEYPLTITAANGVGSDATQAFTLTVNEAPAFTSGSTSSFEVGAAGSFNITTTGYPHPAITFLSSPALPASLTLTDNGDGTATLSGTPAAGEGGVYTLSLTAANGVLPNAAQTLTLTIGQAPAITSTDNAAFAVGTSGSFTVTSTGYPLNTISAAGALPAGVTFVDNGNNTASLSGTPAAGSGGQYTLTITAANGVGSAATQTFVLTVQEEPKITSADHTTFTVGTVGSFTITTNGYPTPAISYSGALPAGVTLVDNGDGTATLSGTPAANSGGSYVLLLAAENGVHAADNQTFTLIVEQAPAITSADNTAFVVGTAGNFSVTSTGYPVNTLSSSGILPGGVSFTDNGDNTAALSGTPAAGSGGLYPLTFTAANGAGSDATQAFNLTVNESPNFTSADHATFTVGSAGSFTIRAQGYPVPAISASGALPVGLTLVDNGDGTATLSGTPAAGTSGSYPLTLTASNGASADAAQTFTLTVNLSPAITSVDNATFVTGFTSTFTVTTTGDPTPAITVSGTLPAGVTFADNGDGTAALSGTPTGAGATYPLTFTAANGVLPDAVQSFTLTVEGPPGVTLVNSAADTGDGALTESEHTAAAITQLLVTFNKSMDAASATNPANYRLQNAAGDVTIDSALYDDATHTATLSINGGTALPDGAYTFTAKGSLQDTLGAPIGADYTLHFTVDTVVPQTTAILTAGNSVIAEGAVLSTTFSKVQVQFSENVADPAGDGGADDVTNPANYLLFQPGADGTFETGSCKGGVAPTDVQIVTGPVVYSHNSGAGPFKALVMLNNGVTLSNGKYRLMVCGSTSIVDAAGNPLGGGQDAARTFSVAVIEAVDEIPVTGFAPGVVSVLPAQPSAAAYSDLGSLWVEIPALGVSASITGVPLQGEQWDVTWLYNQVGWLQGTAFPTWAGNTVLTAHAYTADGLPGPFANLRSLKYDERILLHYAGMQYTYALRNNILTAPDAMKWITRHETLDWLTLVTCQQFNETTRAYDYRRVIRAVLVGVEAER